MTTLGIRSPGCCQVLLQDSSPQLPPAGCRLSFGTKQESFLLCRTGACLPATANLGTVLAGPCDDHSGFGHSWTKRGDILHPC